MVRREELPRVLRCQAVYGLDQCFVIASSKQGENAYIKYAHKKVGKDDIIDGQAA